MSCTLVGLTGFLPSYEPTLRCCTPAPDPLFALLCCSWSADGPWCEVWSCAAGFPAAPFMGSWFSTQAHRQACGTGRLCTAAAAHPPVDKLHGRCAAPAWKKLGCSAGHGDAAGGHIAGMLCAGLVAGAVMVSLFNVDGVRLHSVQQDNYNLHHVCRCMHVMCCTVFGTRNQQKATVQACWWLGGTPAAQPSTFVTLAQLLSE